MKRALISILILTPALLLTGCESNPVAKQWFGIGADVASNMGYGDQAQLVTGVKELLELSSKNAATALSADGAYSNIGLPASMQPLEDTLRKVGMGSYVDKVESAMQEGAEKATNAAKPVFLNAIDNMNVADALGILRGGNDAATQYFRTQTESTLRQKFQPIMEEQLTKTGFYDQYKSMLGVYNALPLTNKPNLDLEQYVLNESMNQIFSRMAQEEATIRSNPQAAGMSILSAVLSGS